MRKKTDKEWIEDFIKIHQDRYDYSNSIFVNGTTKIEIICKSCNKSFLMTPRHHIRGQGCKECSTKRSADAQRTDKNDFIKKSIKMHGSIYDYSNSVYINNHTKLEIICPYHGSFWQTPKNHYRYGCNKCGCEITAEKQTKDISYFISQSIDIHGDKYDYSKVEGTVRDKVIIVCPIHGNFEQKFGNHIYKEYGCPKCACHISKQEIELQEWLSSYVTIETNRFDIIPPQELDILIPSHNIAIEYNGIYWHSETMGKNKNYHLRKYISCRDIGYRLIQIWENEWIYNKDIVKSIILSALGIYNEKIHGRKCKVLLVNPTDARVFYNDNHIQGFQSGEHRGLYYNDELVSLMTVKRFTKAPMLERFVCKKFTKIYGAFSKLLKSFDNIDGMITFSDPRYFSGNVYESNGFSFDYLSKPNYFYFKNGMTELHNRRKFQKNLLGNKLPKFDNNLSEYENMLTNGYHRIWDCGNLKYTLKEVII